MKKGCLLLILFGLLISIHSIDACTGITASKGDTVFFGNNEDWNDPVTYVWYEPSLPGSFGGVYFGYGDFFPQGGMNEMGLCYDGFATPYMAVHNPDNKPQYPGMFVDDIMRQCQTVDEVVEMFMSYFTPWMVRAQLMFIDRFGGSVIIEGDSVVYKQGDFQVCTNFYQTNPQAGGWPCWRYNRAVSMLENSDGPSVELFRDILDAAHQGGNYPTIYSNIYDQRQGICYLYLNHNYDTVLRFDLLEQLQTGFRIEPLQVLETVDFTSDVTSGHAPLTVQFTDLTEDSITVTYWGWDFDSDGIIDSEEQHPTWVYTEPGTYTVSLEYSYGISTYTRIHENDIRIFDGESALQFEENNSYATCSAAPPLNLTDAFTLEAWIYPTGWGAFQGLGFGKILDKRYLYLQLIDTYLNLNRHSLLVHLNHQDGTISYSISPEDAVALDQWQHIAVTYDGQAEVKIYINGMEQAVSHTTPPSGPVMDNSTNDLYIGNDATTGYTFDGTIDELRIWNRLRTGEEIAAHAGSILRGDEDGLIGYWRMNEGGGETIADHSSHHHNGTINGAAWIQGIRLDDVSLDTDGDGIENAQDNCPLIHNPEQEDIDGDIVGDACDNCPATGNPAQRDADDDTTGDLCDSCTDTDGDGYGDPGYEANTCAEDNCPEVYNPEQGDMQTGDIDCDGEVNVMDVLATVNHILNTTPLFGSPYDRADCNGDGGIDVLDVIGLVNVILGLSPECPGTGYAVRNVPEVAEYCNNLRPFLPAEQYTQLIQLLKEVNIPTQFHLAQNYPNPFNPDTEMRYSLAEDTKVTITVYNTLGQVVHVLVDSDMDAGQYVVKWNGADAASGVYFYRLEAGGYSATRKMVLVR